MSYIEYIVSPSSDSYNVEKKEMSRMLATVSKQYKGTTKRFTRYFYQDLVYESGVNEVRVYRKTPPTIETSTNNFIKATMNKEKLPYFMFPSTMQIYDNMDVTAITFRVHTNIYINFETQNYAQDKMIINKVFVNYNVDARDDTDTIANLIKRAQEMLI